MNKQRIIIYYLHLISDKHQLYEQVKKVLNNLKQGQTQKIHTYNLAGSLMTGVFKNYLNNKLESDKRKSFQK